MELPVMVPIEYCGELVAIVSPERVHIIAPRLLARPSGDRELRLVAFMCACCIEVLAGRLAGPYTEELGVEWAQIVTDDARRTSG